MNRLTLSITTLAALALLAAPAAASAAALGLSVNAAVSASTTISAKGVATAKSRASAEITRRVNLLTELGTRLNAMARVSASDKSSLLAGINGQISSMNSLAAQISAETDLASLKSEVQSITKGYRIFMLVMPQARITAAGDRVLTIVAQMQALSAKLSARISADTSANASALQSGYSDMQAKVADANTQASAAISEAAPLQPDNGDASVQAANQAALKDARSKILAATADLKAAYADAQAIIKGVRGTGAASVSASTSASVE